MKKFTLTLFTLFLAFASFAQQAKVGSTEITKVSRPCIIADYGMSYDVIEGALKKKFEELNLKSPDKTKDGYKVFKGVNINDISTDKVDLYYRVENRKPNTTVYMLISRGYDNFMLPESDSAVYQNAIAFLDKFVKDATLFQLNLDVKNQEESIKSAEKNLKKIIDNEDDLNKDKAKVESKISQKIVEQNALKTEMDNQQSILEGLKKKTATLDQMDALKKEVSKQEKAVEKATSNYNSSLKKQDAYKGDLDKVENKIAENKVEIEKAKNALEMEKTKLEEIKKKISDLN
ncbi:MAG: hypothetical protein R2831_08010 [Chitinophagaceae bacterium]